MLVELFIRKSFLTDCEMYENFVNKEFSVIVSILECFVKLNGRFALKTCYLKLEFFIFKCFFNIFFEVFFDSF